MSEILYSYSIFLEDFISFSHHGNLGYSRFVFSISLHRTFIKYCCARFEAFTTVKTQVKVFWVITRRPQPESSAVVVFRTFCHDIFKADLNICNCHIIRFLLQTPDNEWHVFLSVHLSIPLFSYTLIGYFL